MENSGNGQFTGLKLRAVLCDMMRSWLGPLHPTQVSMLRQSLSNQLSGQVHCQSITVLLFK